ncbi:MAG: hypothetical protein WAK55_15060 [Xanthobacteraceae bacterium]
MRQLSTASAAAAALPPVRGSSAARADYLPQVSSQASNGIDAMLAIGIVIVAWAVALWGVSCLSHMAS